jgi:hypothetical protein
VLRHLRFVDGLQLVTSREQLTAHFVNDHRRCWSAEELDQALGILVENGHIERDGDGVYRTVLRPPL